MRELIPVVLIPPYKPRPLSVVVVVVVVVVLGGRWFETNGKFHRMEMHFKRIKCTQVKEGKLPTPAPLKI